MRQRYNLILLLLLNTTAFAQQTILLDVQGHGGDKTDLIDKHAIPTGDGGAIIRITSTLPMNGNIQNCGTINNHEHHFRKYSYTNTLVMDWERCYPPADTMPYFLFPEANGGFYSVVHFRDADNIFKWGLGKEDAAKNIYWLKGYQANIFALRTANRTTDGGFLLAFESYDTGGHVTQHYGSWAWEDIWLLKMDSLGNKLWSKTIGGSLGDYPVRILPAPDGGFYLLAYCKSNDFDCSRTSTATHFFIFRMDVNGNILWKKDYGGSSAEIAYDGCYDGKGGILMCGEAWSNDGDVSNHITGGPEAWVINTDSLGNLLRIN